MKHWQEELLHLATLANQLDDTALSPEALQQNIFKKIAGASAALGFDYCSYGLQLPMSQEIKVFDNYPEGWRTTYVEAGFLAFDPILHHGKKSRAPLVWNQKIFEHVPRVWEEGERYGLKFGWSQSCLDAAGMGGLVTFVRAHGHLDERELRQLDMQLRWLVNITHLSISALQKKILRQHAETLSGREIEILRMSAVGKTSEEIAQQLHITSNTINFHMKNAIHKLQVSNKTAAVAKAVMLGLLN